MYAMKKFRVVFKDADASGKKHTRHVRATDVLHATQQARVIIRALGGVVASVIEMGRVG
jgi:hypothetical protein